MVVRSTHRKVVLGIRLILHVASFDTLALQVPELSWWPVAILEE
jgi:hypothetical protein